MPPTITTPQIPVVGPWLGTFGKIQRIMATPCEVSPEIWVLAFFAGAPMAVASLFKPDPFDMATERFGLAHKKKRRRRFRYGEAMRLPIVKRRGMQWVVFTLGSLAERVGWYMLIADVAFEWAYNWSSMAYQWSGCRNPNASWGYNRVTQEMMITINGTWAGWNHTAHHGKITTDDFSVIAVEKMNCSPYIKLKVGPNTGIGPTAKNVRFRLRDMNTGWQSDPYDAEPSNPNHQNEWNEVWPDYLGLGSRPRLVLDMETSGGFINADIKIGLNGDNVPAVISDP